MTDKPILFSGPMIRAILDGRKTQTRRVLKPLTPVQYERGITACETPDGARWRLLYAIGDRLWVREKFAVSGIGWGKKPIDAIGGKVHYTADPDHGWHDYWGNWHPSIHMPRWASRLTLVVTDVRVQRLQEISEADARAEGARFAMEPTRKLQGWTFDEVYSRAMARDAFAHLWDGLNAKRGFGWAANPWVVALTFTVHRCNIDQMATAS
ncbi:hypothetical protein [Actibacterium sp. MT2.3-13A]|uniref:hypothetical protein n=1 Tax=Actibacterium sp. MT2.3-13A TaxID=2828332 RepID=UPI001BA7CD7F|nr:hypothetical protein [Actibacterium sp. MT2.3-13A]